MSGGHLQWTHERLAQELYGWGPTLSYGGRGFKQVTEAGRLNPLEDRELSKMCWDLLCVLHSFDYYKSGDIGEDGYREDVQYFKDKWLKPGRKATAKRLVDEEVERLRKELYQELGIHDQMEISGLSPEAQKLYRDILTGEALKSEE